MTAATTPAETVFPLLDQMPCFLWSVDAELRFTSVAGGVLRTFDVAPAQMIGTSLLDYLEDGSPAVEAHHRALKGEAATCVVEYQGRTYQAHVRPLGVTAAGASGCIGIGLDITDRIAAEGAVTTEREGRQRERSEHAAVSNFVRAVSEALVQPLTQPEMLTACADATSQHLGAACARIWLLDDARELLVLQASSGPHAPLTDVDVQVPIGTDNVGRIGQLRQPHLTNELTESADLAGRDWIRREGLRAFAGYPLVVEDRLVGVIAMFARAPVTAATLDALGSVAHGIASAIERKRLESSASILAAIVEGSEDAVMSIDMSGIVTTWNQGAERLYGYTAAEIIGRPVSVLSPNGDGTQSHAWLERLRLGERLPTTETVRRRKDGSLVEVALTISPIRDSRGRIVASSGIIRDITERKRLESQVQQAHKMEAVGRLAGGIAHDFNNLLTIINGYTQVLDGMLEGQGAAREMLGEIRDAGSRAAILTQQLLAYSRKQMLNARVLNLNEVLADARNMLARLIGEDVEMSLTLDPALRPVRADAGQLAQVVMNLCVNARDAMPTGGRVGIETANVSAAAGAEVPHGNYALLSVSDTGCGIDGETLPHIFEPFFTTKNAGHGTGLGLATVYGIVQQSGGHIRVDSRPGGGTTFRIYLPAVDEETAPHPGAPAAHVCAGNETVLLVEDEDSVRALARLLLQRCGYTVLVAANGAEALEVAALHAKRIDLLLADVVMPGMSGRQVAEALRREQPSLKVIYMSGYTDDAILRHGVTEAETAFVQKPFTPALLTAMVRDVLDGRA